MRLAVVRNQIGHPHDCPWDRRHALHERHAIVAQVRDPLDKPMRSALPPDLLPRGDLDDVGVRKGGEDVPGEVRDQVSSPQARLDTVILLAGLEAMLTEPSGGKGVGKAVFPGDLEEFKRGGGSRAAGVCPTQRRRRGARKDIGVGPQIQGILNALAAGGVEVQGAIVA